MIGIVNKELAQNYPVQRNMVKEQQPEKIPEFVDGFPVGEIIRSLRNLQHGSVQITIQDSRVIQIDRTEKKRITYKTEADYSI